MRNNKRWGKKVTGTLLLIVLVTFSCDNLNIFNSDASNEENFPDSGSDRPVLIVHKTGGFAGVNETIELNSSGLSKITGNHLYTEKRINLSGQAVERIRASLIQNQFFKLESEYVDQDVRDAFFYEIWFENNGQSRTVYTNGFNVPANLERILQEINQLENSVLNDGLKMEVKLDKETMKAGDSTTVQFVITNTSTSHMKLVFNSAQMYDIRVHRSITDNQSDLVWNWAHDRFFAQSVVVKVLIPEQNLTFTEIWDGKNNQGEQVLGTFWVSGELVSTPGGITSGARIVLE